jgi:general L-amino acid transport system substrate-binding protein
MRDFVGMKVCVLGNSMYSSHLNEYNQKYALGLKILEMPTLTFVKEGFYLNRCDLISGDEIFIRTITKELKSENTTQILPEEIAFIPIKAYSAGNNPTLSTALRWIINGLKAAYASEISSHTIDTFSATKNQSIKNLLGFNNEVWKTLKINPNWVKSFIKEYGNYQQILEKNIGKTSPLGIDIKQNDLVEKNGFLTYVPFI